MSFQAAFKSFMSEGLESAVDSSTKASWGGGGYSVELSEDGNYRVLPDGNIGDLYVSKGLIIGVPALGDDEWDEDEDLRFYDNAETYMEDAFSEAIAEQQNA